jgi:hypothetical protein
MLLYQHCSVYLYKNPVGIMLDVPENTEVVLKYLFLKV